MGSCVQYEVFGHVMYIYTMAFVANGAEILLETSGLRVLSWSHCRAISCYLLMSFSFS